MTLSLIAGVAHAFEPLIDRLPGEARRSELFANRAQRASVKDGPLLGHGSERSSVAVDGTLEVLRTRTYDRIRDPESRRVVALPDQWQISSTLVLSPSLRLRETTTTLRFHRSIDRALGYAFSEQFEDFFEWDRAYTVASRDGRRLTRTLTRAGKVVEHDTYDYPRDAIPLEIVALAVADAIKYRVREFEFELLLPGGDRHGIHARVHRTRDLKPFAKGYPVPLTRIAEPGEMAVVDMWLASPVKRVFFPHHFYLVYASDDPAELIALWGGDPDEDLQAYRE